MIYRSNSGYRHDETQNESRADQAEHALTVASDKNAQRARGSEITSEAATDVSDLLASMIHFCARSGVDWNNAVERAEHAAIGDLEDGPEAVRDTDRFPAEVAS